MTLTVTFTLTKYCFIQRWSRHQYSQRNRPKNICIFNISETQVLLSFSTYLDNGLKDTVMVKWFLPTDHQVGLFDLSVKNYCIQGNFHPFCPCQQVNWTLGDSHKKNYLVWANSRWGETLCKWKKCKKIHSVKMTLHAYSKR